MKRVAWLTDIHLNFLDERGRRWFVESVGAESPDAVLLGGDIGESPDVAPYLQEMADAVRRPIYFVLGNHDFYRGSIAATRQQVARLAAESQFLVYLSSADVVELSPTTALVGHDGWGDARLGDFYGSDVLLNDFLLIDELHLLNAQRDDLDRPRLEPLLNALGDEAAEHFARVLPEAFETHRRVIALTHVPPFREAAWYDGKPSDKNWLPFFACKAVGDAMLDVMRAHADRELMILCGHTHGSGITQPHANLRVLTGGAKYYEPRIQEIFDLE